MGYYVGDAPLPPSGRTYVVRSEGGLSYTGRTYALAQKSKNKMEDEMGYTGLAIRQKEEGFWQRFWRSLLFWKSAPRSIPENFDQLEEEVIDITPEINESLAKIAKLKYYTQKINLPILKDIQEITQIVHDVILKHEIKIQKLIQFHNYYTDHFIAMFDKILKTYDDKVVFLQKLEEQILEKLKVLDSELGICDRNILQKSEYTKYVRKYLSECFDRHVVKKNMGQEIDLEKLKKFAGVSSKLLPAQKKYGTGKYNSIEDYLNHLEVTGNDKYYRLAHTVPTELIQPTDTDAIQSLLKTVAQKTTFTKIEHLYMNDLFLTTFGPQELNDFMYLGQLDQEPCFSYQSRESRENMYFSIVDGWIIDLVNPGKIPTDTNQARKYSLSKDKSQLVLELEDLRQKKIDVNFDPDTIQLVSDYLKKIKGYYDDVNTSFDAVMEKDNLKKILELEMLKID